MADDHGHMPVLAETCLELCRPRPGQVMLDATLGRGGHASLFIPHLAGGAYVGLDLDAGNLAYAGERLAPIAAAHGVTLVLRHASFAQAPGVLEGLELPTLPGVPGVPGVLLADLGFASNQVDDPGRGLSFAADGPLDMRLDTSAGVTAAELVNQLPEADLADLLFGLGEEKLSRRIARKIVETRQKQPINTTAALADLVRQAYGPAARRQRIDPATRTFMALRIAVNDELGALERLIETLPRIVAEGGRAAIISFHSLEDRRVKQGFAALAQTDGWRLVTRKPLTASTSETARNPRSRSAKLRVIERAG